MATEPTAVRPLDAYCTRLSEASTTSTRLDIIEPKAIVNIRGDAEDAGFADAVRTALGLRLPTEPNRCSSTDNSAQGAVQVMYWLGPDEWLAMAANGQALLIETAICAARPDDPRLSVVDLSHAYTGLRLSGPNARDVLASGCSLDLHQRSFDVDHCAQTMLAKSRILLRQVSVEPAFEIWVRNSYARYLADWLLDAMELAGKSA